MQPKECEKCRLGRKDAGRVRSALLAGVPPGRFITFHHSCGPPPPPRIRHFDTTLWFSPAAPSARPLATPGSSGYPIANKCNRSYSDRSGGTFTHPTEFDTFRHFSTLFDTTVEFCRIPHSGRCFRLMFALDMGCILKMGKGLFEIGFVPKKHFCAPPTTRSVVPKMMRSDYSGECPSPRLRRLVFKMDCALGRGAAEFAVVQVHRDRSCIAEQHPQVKLGAV